MKTCNTCKTRSANTALFCPACGSSYNLRLCPRLHPNPPTADYCLICGSPQLSRPHHLRLPTRFHRVLTAILLLAVGLVAIAFAIFLYFQTVSFSSNTTPPLIRFFATLLTAFKTAFYP